MKELHFNDIADKIAKMCIDAACILEDDITSAIDMALELEKSPLGIEVLDQSCEAVLMGRESAR